MVVFLGVFMSILDQTIVNTNQRKPTFFTLFISTSFSLSP